jgi:retinol dehydrogenase-14
MKTAVITGGNSGIGKAVAIQLAQKGYRVIIHGRDLLKTQLAAEEIKKISGNNNVEFIAADISLIKNMKELADAIKQKTDSIHALVLSTGVILPKHIITADGLEAGFAIQYLSRFAVTQLLTDELTHGHAKIVQVGASVLPNAAIHFDDLALKKDFTVLKAMAQEMFANHLFIQEFARRHPENNMIMNMGEVGIAKTGIVRNLNFFFRLGVALFGKSPEKAAKNFTFLVSDDSVNFSGYYIRSNGKINKKEKIQYDSVTAEKLWNTSLDLLKPIL